jgi:hypothetical protein
MNLYVLVVVLAIAMSDCGGCLPLPRASVDCSIDIDGAPKSETYPECYCTQPWKPGQVPGRPECEDRE